MSFINILLATGASLLFLGLVFIPMDKAFPAKPGQRIFRPKWFLEIMHDFFNNPQRRTTTVELMMSEFK